MKKSYLILIIFILFGLCSTKCYAEEVSPDDIYQNFFEQSGADRLNDYLPQDIDDYMELFDLDNPHNSVKENLNVKNVFSILADFLKNNIKTPLKTGILILCLILFSSALGSTYDNKMLHFVTNISVSAVAVFPAVSIAVGISDAISSSGTFMLAFVPVMAVLIAVKGKPLTSAGFVSVMTIAVQTVTMICSYFVVPLSSMQLAVGISSSLSHNLTPPAVASTIKKISTWTLTFICTVFLCILSIQTAINSPADNLYSKTAKFVLGSAVPVVGNVVSEAFNTVRGSLQLLNSSVALYAVLAVAFILLPILIELIVWRMVLGITHSLSEMLNLKETAILIKSVDQCFALLLGLSILVFALFIISIGIVTVV